ncbi:MAG: phosphoribosylformylglycinamidine synthase [Clostridiales bacterium]|nr:phosphoribosylformylglycinamidine synthase [Clostridiales bacterium]
MVYRIYTERKKGFEAEAKALLSDIREFLLIKSVSSLRILNRYDVENTDRSIFDACIKTVFSEPQTDNALFTLPKGDYVFATEYLPGQFDQRADSCAQCIQFVSGGEKPLVRTAKVYILGGNLTEDELSAIKKYVINPVESREASLDMPKTLDIPYEVPADVPVMDGFLDLDEDGLRTFISEYALAMDFEDVLFCQQYFRSEGRCPTLTEIRMIDTYWSDHCRHTTFLTIIDRADIEDKDVRAGFERYLSIRSELGREKPMTLMDIATIGAKYLKKTGHLDKLDESEEINACTVKVKVDVDGRDEDWLFLFKNETHNHPTEIEPFGGAATCIGGAIRDPLSGRAYVYQAMRVTGAGDPTVPISETLPGKLPQRKIVTTAAAGYSSYGNQIGLATGLVDEIYHSGYIAKRMEIGAVVGAAPQKNVRREKPVPGDLIVLLGGRTGRDGCGGATGSSKSHNLESLESCGAEVQKGNAPEERKLQRLFRNGEAARLIKRCNDFGAGGVSVAIGELADGLKINLDAIPKKYEGLDGTELAISESQERMAVVLDKNDVKRFIELAEGENLEATVVAEVQQSPRLVINWRGKTIVDISREFLNSNGAEKRTVVSVQPKDIPEKQSKPGTFKERMTALAGDLNVCSKRGLSERFDSTVGAGTVLMPFGGKYQRTPIQSMVAKIPVMEGDTSSCSVMAYGYNPYISEVNQYVGAYLAVIESVSKLVATGASLDNCYLTFQEYFEKLGTDPRRWGKPFSALLGALSAQLDLKLAAIGGKDSMSGSFEDIDVPPTLVSFAVSVCSAENIISPEFKRGGSTVRLLLPEYGENGLPKAESLLKNFSLVLELISKKRIISAYTPTYGGVAEGVMKMCLGNRFGFDFDSGVDERTLFDYRYGAFILETEGEIVGKLLGHTRDSYALCYKGETVSMDELEEVYEGRLEKIFPSTTESSPAPVKAFSYEKRSGVVPAIRTPRPRVLIPVFPGTNCEYDTARAFEKAGAEPTVLVIKNLSPSDIAESVERMEREIGRSQIIMIPGGFSGGDEPDGSGKFITAFFRNPRIKNAVHELLGSRDGLMGGICNGFQALIKTGLLPYGYITDTDENSPTLTHNTIGRHQSKIVRTRVASVKSPWLASCSVGDIHSVAISHGEGRFVCPEGLLKSLGENGQIATQYVDLEGNPTMEIQYNPNGSLCAIEGITSPDGRIFGKMGHSERKGSFLYKNVPGNFDNGMFESAVNYFK